MKGATALDWKKTISNPNSTKTTTIGTSQYFFSCRRNRQNSESTRPLLIRSSIHPRVVLPIAIARRIRRPAAVGAAAARERILAEQPPHDAERHEDDDEHQREEDAGVEVADDARAAPPPDARPRQQRGRRGAEHDQHRADRADDFRANDPSAPDEQRRDHREHAADRQPERSFGSRHRGSRAIHHEARTRRL